MTYKYIYRTSANEEKSGSIVAKDRNDVYAKLKRQGIKPSRVIGRDPVHWRRWSMILVLSIALIALYASRFYTRLKESVASDIRSQIYCDPSLIQRHVATGWLDTFDNPGDAWLARHARPGIEEQFASPSNLTLSTKPVRILKTDADEIRKIKKLVNGMKLELAAYLDGGGTVADYIQLCKERITTEKKIYQKVEGEMESFRRRIEDGSLETSDAAPEWEKRNALLRSFGLPTFTLPSNQP